MPLRVDIVQQRTALENGRKELFKLKETLEPFSSESMKRRLDDAIQELNHICRDFNALRPVSTLPPEILARIFEEAVITYEVSQKYDRYAGELGEHEMNVTISQVCRRWRMVALGTPRLWREVHVGLHTHPDALSAILERCGALPINLSLDYYHCEESDDVSTLISIVNAATKHSRRARLVKILFDLDSLPLIYWPTAPTAVEVLQIDREDANMNYSTIVPSQDLTRVCPRLRSFTGQGLNDVAEWTLPTTLTNLDLYKCALSATNLPRFIETLGSLSRLRELSMERVSVSGDTDAALPHVSLPRMRILNVSLNDAKLFSALLSHISFSHLDDLQLYLDGVHFGLPMLKSCLTEAGQLARNSFPLISRVRLIVSDANVASVKLIIKKYVDRGVQDLHMRIEVTLSAGFPLRAAHEHIPTFLAELPLEEVRTAELFGSYPSWLCQQTKLLLPNVSNLVIATYFETSKLRLYRMLQDSPFGEVPFCALRSLVLRNVDIEGLAIEEVCETFRSRPLPIEGMTVSFIKCRNVRRSELKRLASLITVLWDKKGEIRSTERSGYAH